MALTPRARRCLARRSNGASGGGCDAARSGGATGCRVVDARAAGSFCDDVGCDRRFVCGFGLPLPALERLDRLRDAAPQRALLVGELAPAGLVVRRHELRFGLLLASGCFGAEPFLPLPLPSVFGCAFWSAALLSCFRLVLVRLRSRLAGFGARQRHRPARLDHVELARQQHHEAALLADAAGDPAGVVAGAEIEVGARRADDGGAGVLRHHQPAEFVVGRGPSIGSSASMKNGVP